MKIFILVVIMHVNSGSIINFQEFYSLEKCQYAATVVNDRGNKQSTTDAFCLIK